MQPSQSSRALTAPPVGPPQMSPSGSFDPALGFEQVPTAGLVPETMLQVTPAPPPQQSPSWAQMSPVTRQPLATWQTWPPVEVATHSRLQQ